VRAERRRHARLAALLFVLALAFVALAVAWHDQGLYLVAVCTALAAGEQFLLSRGVQLW
jgi:ferric-dicitrate binding protein FerR (iron transport regulator)